MFWTPPLAFLFLNSALRRKFARIACLSRYCQLITQDISKADVMRDVQNHVCGEHTRTLQTYWSDMDVIGWLAENNNDGLLKKVKRTAEQHAAKKEVASWSVLDEKASFDEGDKMEEGEVSSQACQQKCCQISAPKAPPKFESLGTPAAGHYVQDTRELTAVPVSNSLFTCLTEERLFIFCHKWSLLQILRRVRLPSRCTASTKTIVVR